MIHTNTYMYTKMHQKVTAEDSMCTYLFGTKISTWLALQVHTNVYKLHSLLDHWWTNDKDKGERHKAYF